MDRRPTIRGDMTFREWIRAAASAEERAIRYLWCEQQSYLAVHLDYKFLTPFYDHIYEQPVLVIHDYGYVNSVAVGDYLGCAVGRATSEVEVVAMPTRKRLRLEVVSGPQVETKFEWKRDLLLPFWQDGLQRRLF